jgi:hypothetical protein
MGEGPERLASWAAEGDCGAGEGTGFMLRFIVASLAAILRFSRVGCQANCAAGARFVGNSQAGSATARQEVEDPLHIRVPTLE